MGTKVEQGKGMASVGDEAQRQVVRIGLTENIIFGKDLQEMRENCELSGKSMFWAKEQLAHMKLFL